jgi:hypothetical protein
MPEFSIDSMIVEVRREITMREQVYPNLVAGNKLTQATSDRRIGIMHAILRMLIQQKEKDRLL